SARTEISALSLHDALPIYVDHRVDVYIDFGFGYAECAWAFDGGLGINIDIANLSVDHQAVGQHIVSTDLKGQTPRVIQLQAAEALSFALAAQVFLEECGVVNADTDIRLESRFAVQRVVNHAEGRRQVLDVAQFAIQSAKPFNTYFMAEWGG